MNRWVWFPNSSALFSPQQVSYLWQVEDDKLHITLLAKVYMHAGEFIYSIKDRSRAAAIRKECEYQIERRKQALAELVVKRFKQADSIN